jgi:23S rRNA (uracil1939-C5)-methyltransferase
VRNKTPDSARKPPPTAAEIIRIGADGDGIAALPDGTPLYIPLALPGETVRARPIVRHGGGWLAEADTILAESPTRTAPPCGHFGACGGCVLQHWQTADYQSWKVSLLATALQRAGFDAPPIAPLIPGQPFTRRRMDLAARRVDGRVRLGLHRLRGAEVIDLTECHVLHPALFGLLVPLRALLQRLRGFRRESSVVANLLHNGADLLLRTDADLSLSDRTALTALATTHGLPRIAWARGGGDPEPVCVLQPPVTSLSGVPVTPPPGGFLQASRTGEATILAAVLAALPERLPARARIADLYAGCGTLSFGLAERARVAAWEGDAATVAALRTAANQAGLAGRVEATQRDLARQPLMPAELTGFAAAVLDPPHAGAAAQTAQLAAAKVPVVVYVSCNPAALSRDAGLLKDAGYRLTAATPIDQFLWSARLESVCVFRL